MKKELYAKDIASYCYAGIVDGRVLLITVGPDNPFGYPGELNTIVAKYAEQCGKPEVEVYVHILSCTGSDGYCRMLFNKELGGIIFHSIESFEPADIDIPQDIVEHVKAFYEKQGEEVLRCSVLSDRGKEAALASLLGHGKGTQA